MTFKKKQKPWNKGLKGYNYLKHYKKGHPMFGKKLDPWGAPVRAEQIKHFYEYFKTHQEVLE